MRRKPISIKSVAKSLSPDEIKLNEYQQIERETLGIYYCLDSNNFITDYTNVFSTYEEYYKARTTAELLINEGKPVPEPLRSKLIQVKSDLKRKKLKSDIRVDYMNKYMTWEEIEKFYPDEWINRNEKK